MSKWLWVFVFAFTMFMSFYSFYRFDTDGREVVWLVGGLIWLANAFMSGHTALSLIVLGREE